MRSTSLEKIKESKEEIQEVSDYIMTYSKPKPIKKSYNIYKDPVTDDGTKRSLKGKVAVFKGDDQTVMVGFEQNTIPGEYYVNTQCTDEEENTGLLQTIYEDGKFYNQVTLTEIRERLNNLK